MLRKIIQDELDYRQSVNPSYSLRAYARYLKVNVTTLSLYLRGKRQLSPATTQAVVDRLRKVIADQLQTISSPNDLGRQSPQDLAELSDWYHFAILSLMESHTFEHDTAWIARRLRVSEGLVAEAIDRLKLHGLVKETQGHYLLTQSEGQENSQSLERRATRKQKPILEFSDAAKKTLDWKQTLLHPIRVDANPTRIAEAKQRIQEFREEVIHYLEGGEEEKETYQVFIEMMPFGESEGFVRH